MMYLVSIGSGVERNPSYREEVQTRETEVSREVRRLREDRSDRSLDRLRRLGRMTANERLMKVLDPGADSFDLGLFFGSDGTGGEALPTGVFCVIGTVCGRHCVVIANDNTQKAGAWGPGAPQKIQRAQNVALQLRIPVIWLVECPGLYLPTQEQTYAGAGGAGGIFRDQVRHSQAGLPQIAAVFGDCIAGGGYLPVFCDRVIMTEQASICIGGAALNRYSKAGEERPGGPGTHVHGSGCADERVPDDGAAIERIRELVAALPTPAAGFWRVADTIEPAYPTDDLYDLVPPELHRPFEMVQVIARIADGSGVEPIEPDTGEEIYACRALIAGLPVIVIANDSGVQRRNVVREDGTPVLGSILYAEGIRKMTRVVEMSRMQHIPVIWLQDVSGFDIGEAAEKEGLLRYGTHLLRSLTNVPGDPPHLTILLRKASGAGYYAMKGRPFEPAWIAATVTARLEVMSPGTLASTMYDARIERASTPEERARLIESRSELEARQGLHAGARAAAARGDVDTIVEWRDLRRLARLFVEAAWQNPATSYPRP